MCGLLAFIGDTDLPADRRAAIGRAVELMHHRGPDETAVEVVAPGVVLGHKRLAVIDVAASQEPLRYPATGPDAGRYLLIFNGEIYNYLELRDILIRRHGARFATEGDGEVLVAGYAQWGADVLRRLRGMFAFVIWDTRDATAFGARDPFGIKPLYFARTPDGAYFASERKVLAPLLAPVDDADLDRAGLSYYLTLQYVPEPGTLHRGVRRLGPGESFRYSPGGELATTRYFRPTFRPAPVADPTALYQRIQDTLRDSVRLHLRADVPVGAFLSSGIDSTAVVALAREVKPDILTFTAGFDVPGYSEIEVAQHSAQHLDVTTIPVRVTPQDMMEALPSIVWHLDDPVADPSIVGLWFVAKKAAEHVTVVLSGEGSDEFFGGYTIYREPLSLAGVQRLPAVLRRGLRAVADVVPDGVRGKSFVQRGTTPIEQRYYGNARMFDEVEKQRLMRRYDPGVHYTDVTAPLYAEAAHLDDVATMQHIDVHTWLRGDILVKADRMSMAHSLELRVPFLDPVVFDVAARLPVELKLPAGSTGTKVALRRALTGVVPPAIVNRRKLGFPTPTRVWLAGPMYDWAGDILARSATDHILDLQYARDLLDRHRRGDGDHSRKIWTVLTFCLWHAIFVERSLTPAGPPTRRPERPAAQQPAAATASRPAGGSGARVGGDHPAP